MCSLFNIEHVIFFFYFYFLPLSLPPDLTWEEKLSPEDFGGIDIMLIN